MYKNLEDVLPDISVKSISERRSLGFDILEKSFDVVKNFILKKKRIIYGGMAIDMALKAAKHEGIYATDAIPDYDFMSCDMYNDSIELADLLYKEFGDVKIDAINALHPTTRRVRINFAPIADITYVSQQTYEKVPTIEYKGFRVIHPTFQRMDIHRAFCNPLENVPREVVFFRTNKDIKRFILLDQEYPLTQSSIDIKNTVTIVIPSKYFNDSLVGGGIAHVLGYDTTMLLDTTIVVPKMLEKQFRTINICSEEPTKVRDSIIADYPKASVKYYNKFQDDIRPPAIVVDTGDFVFDIHDMKQRLTPYKTHQSNKIVGPHGILMYYLERYFNSDDPAGWMWLYVGLLQWLKRNKTEILSETYGFYNWSITYLVNAQKQYAQIEEYEIPQARPPGRYDPASGIKPAKFDAKTSWLFDMGGNERSDFKETTLRFTKQQ